MDLSIIIVNWRSLDYLRACISSIYQATHAITYEIIVIDNASGDGCEKVIPQEFPDVVFIPCQQNLGFGKANNLAYALSSGEILLFLNPDTEVKDNSFARMVAHLRLDKSFGVVGACLLNSDGSVQTSCIRAYPTLWNQILDSELLRGMFPTWRIWGTKALFSSSGEPKEVEAISGACLMVKRAVFNLVGLFTETYFMYGEDVDLNYKVSKAGYRIQYVPECRVIHHGGKSSSKRESFFPDLWQKESRLQFFQGNKGRLYAHCYRATLAVSAAVRMALIVLSMPLGQLAFRDKNRKLLARKWFVNLQWAVGIKSLHQTQDYQSLRSSEADTYTSI